MTIDILLFLAGVAGGALNALAGGGSFIIFPALLFAGVPPVLANASNTFAALPGYVSGAVGYRRAIGPHLGRLALYCLVAALFGYLGAELLLVVSDEGFVRAVPWLIGFSVVLFAMGGRVHALAARRGGGRGMKALGGALLLLLLAAVCLYGGFFNAALGIMLLAFLALAGMTDIHAMNGVRLCVSSVVAVVATARFAADGMIDWRHGGVALVGATIGGYAAARLSHLIPTRWIRLGVIAYGTGLTLYFLHAASVA